MENPTISDPFGDGVSPESKKIARDNALKFGLYLGIISVCISLIFYLIDPLLVVKVSALGYVIILISILASVYFTLEIRKAIGGFWNFKFAFSSIFIMFLVSILISQVYQVVLVKVIDKDYSQKIIDASLEKARRDMAAKGITGETLDKQMEMVKGFIPDMASTKTLLLGFLFSVVFATIGSLIYAAIFKKDKPVFSTSA